MNKQIWKKKGLIISPPNTRWGKTHCMLPTPIKISNTKYRIFFATRNKKNQSSISYADIKFDKYGIKDLVYPKKNLLLLENLVILMITESYLRLL